MIQASILINGFLVVVLMCFGSPPSNAQTPSSVLDSMELSVKTRTTLKNESWVITEKEKQETSAHYEWRDEKKMVSIIIREAESKAEAREMLTQTALRIPVPYKVKLTEYGDEAYLYQADGQGPSTILIIQGNLFIHVRSSHSSNAHDFAKEVCGIVKNQKAQK